MLSCGEFFCWHAAPSFEKQLYFWDLVGQVNWQFDMDRGLLSFGDHKWRIQILGTESDKSWLWAWANDTSQVSPELLRAVTAVRIRGQLQNIPEFTEPEHSLDVVDGHTLAMIASGLCQANAYYRAPYDRGALFMLIQDDKFPRCEEPPLMRGEIRVST